MSPLSYVATSPRRHALQLTEDRAGDDRAPTLEADEQKEIAEPCVCRPLNELFKLRERQRVGLAMARVPIVSWILELIRYLPQLVI